MLRHSDSYVWHGEIYTRVVFIFTTNQFGCDSTATLNLTINFASSSSVDATACESYDWNGVHIIQVVVILMQHKR